MAWRRYISRWFYPRILVLGVNRFEVPAHGMVCLPPNPSTGDGRTKVSLRTELARTALLSESSCQTGFDWSFTFIGSVDRDCI